MARTASKPAVAPDREHNIGAFIASRRKARGLNQTELAELAGVGRRFVSELEAGKASVRADVTNRVLAVFGKTLGVVDAPRIIE